MAIAQLMVRFCPVKELLAGDRGAASGVASGAARGPSRAPAKQLLADKNRLPKGSDSIAHGGDSRRLDTCTVFAAQPDLVL